MGFSSGAESSPLNVDLATANANRSVAMGGTSIVIFTFLFGFFYPRYASGEIDSVLFQIALTVIGSAIFSFVFSGVYYYQLSLSQLVSRTRQERVRRRADSLWVIGFSLLFLDPSLMLLTVGLTVVAMLWLGLWILYVIIITNVFRETQAWLRKAS